VEIVEIVRDPLMARIVPRADPDPAPCEDPPRALCFRAEIRTPGPIARASGLGKGLAVRIGAFQTAEITAFTEAHAGDKKAHRMFLRKHHRGTKQQYQTCDNRHTIRFHRFLPDLPVVNLLEHTGQPPEGCDKP
jgi:hypothetical protein